MTITKRLTVFSLALVIAGLTHQASAIELLTSGDFEVEFDPIGEVPFWTLEEYRSANPSNVTNTAALVGFANNPGGTDGEFGLWLRAFSGNLDDGLTDAILSQSVAATPGETYTFSGQALFEQNYAGGVATLDSLSPFGAIPSPTKSEFELAFLDSNGAVIGSPIVKDVAEDIFNGLGYDNVTPISGVAPAGAASVRVRAMGREMAFNVDPSQTAFYDNFSLTAASAPTTELLMNGDLNQAPEAPPTAEDFFEFFGDSEELNTLAIAGFANNPDTGGANGAWVRPFVGSGVENTAVRQTVAGEAGVEYTFAASSRFEPAFFGGAGSTANQTLIELAFLDSLGEVISTVDLDLREDAGQTADNLWHSHTISGVAPDGTAEVRVAGVVNNLTNNEAGGAQSAFWDDFSLMAAVSGLPGDYNGDGNVDAADYTVWRDGDSPDSSPAGYTLWADNYGTTSATSTAVPEPSTVALLALAFGAVIGRRRG